MLHSLPRNEEGLLCGFLADIEPDPYAGFRLAFANGATSKGAAVAVLAASRNKCTQHGAPPTTEHKSNTNIQTQTTTNLNR